VFFLFLLFFSEAVRGSDTADIDLAKLSFQGFKPSTFGGIDGHAFDVSSANDPPTHSPF
jgi:hypothetical protein